MNRYERMRWKVKPTNYSKVTRQSGQDARSPLSHGILFSNSLDPPIVHFSFLLP